MSLKETLDPRLGDDSGSSSSSENSHPHTNDAAIAQNSTAVGAVASRPELKREFGFFSAFSFAMSISGLFSTIGTTFSYPLSSGGAVGVVWAWLMGGVGCMCIALSVAELVSAHPTSGGLYYSCSKIFPKAWAPVICWVDGWVNILGQVAGVASSAYGAGGLLLSAASMGSNFSYQPTERQVVGVMAALLIFFGAINSFPTSYLEKITSSYVILHFSCLIAGAVTLLSMTFPKHEATYVFGHLESNNGWSPVGFSFLLGCLSVNWTMTDYSATAGLCEEMKSPGINAPWAIALAMFLTYIAGFMYNIVLVFCMGDPQLLLSESQPVAMMYYRSTGKGGGIFFTVAMFVVMTMVSCSSLQACSRTMWSQARDGMIPYVGKRWLYRVNKKTLTPLYAVWVSTVLAIGINCIALGSAAAINAVFNVCAIALDWSYIIPIVGRRWFDADFEPGPWYLGKAGVFINWWAFLWTFFISIIFFMPTELPVTPQNMNYAVVFFVGIFGLSVIFWNAGGYKLYRGPEATAPNPEVAAEIDYRGQVKDEKRE